MKKEETKKTIIGRIVDYFRIRKQILAQQVGIFIALLIFGGTFAIISPAFRNFTNLQNVAVNISFTLLASLLDFREVVGNLVVFRVQTGCLRD